jgi:hypothetical protein
LCKDLYLNDEKSQAQLLLGFVAEKFLALGEVKNSEIEFLPEDFQENIRVEALNFQMMAKDFTDSLIDKELAAKISFDIKKFITELTNDFDQKPPSLSLNSPSGDKVLVGDNQRSV